MPVFLGVVVQPKTKRPIYVLQTDPRRAYLNIQERTLDGEYEEVGSGYFDTGGYEEPAVLTGYPRSHTPSGVTEKGGGYGAALYTGLVVFAHAEAEGEVKVSGLIGSGSGISSSTDVRSTSADKWWKSYTERGLVYQVEGTVGGDEEQEEEEEDSGDLSDYVSSRGLDKITSAIRDAVNDEMSSYSDDGWWVTSISDLRVNVVRTTMVGADEKEVVADVYTLENAAKADLVAVIEVVDGGIDSWARRVGLDFEGEGYKNAIVAMNYAGEDPKVVARFVDIARHLGATDTELKDMVALAGVNTSSRETAEAAIATGVEASGPSAEGVEMLRVSRRVSKSALLGALGRLEKRRAKLGWHLVEDLD